jgi:hypothetical protein
MIDLNIEDDREIIFPMDGVFFFLESRKDRKRQIEKNKK